MRHDFYGWYFRCQGKSGTAAVIPAVHLSPEKECCSIQVITPSETLYREFPISQFRMNRKRGIMQIGNNLFSHKGIRLQFMGKLSQQAAKNGHKTEDGTWVMVSGRLEFGKFAEPKYDIMGPFAYIPGMECRHAVYSMRHTVNGILVLDEKKMMFQNGMGYMEGDRGTSFPDQYIWTQSFFPGGSIMIAAASIPLVGMHFTGTIGFVFKNNREYRFATYLGASVIKMKDREFLIRQGRCRLHVRFLGSGGGTLKAPDKGNMTRKVWENIACSIEYTLSYRNRTLLHIVTDQAAAEYEVTARASFQTKE